MPDIGPVFLIPGSIYLGKRADVGLKIKLISVFTHSPADMWPDIIDCVHGAIKCPTVSQRHTSYD